MYKNKSLLLFIVILLKFNLTAQSNNCNNNAGNEVISGTSCTTSAFNTANNGNYWTSVTGCNTGDFGDRWIWFTATSTSTTITYSPNSANEDPIITLFTGACDQNYTSLSCSDNGNDGDDETIVFATTIGIVYRVRLQNYNTNNNMNGTICVFGPLPLPPANDDCTGAYSLTVNSDLLCGNTTTGTVLSATQSTQPATDALGGCSADEEEDDDVWFSFIATEVTHTIDILNTVGTSTDIDHSLWEGSCPGGLTLYPGSCSNPNSSTVAGLTIGNTYYLRVYSRPEVAHNTTFDVCIGTPPLPANNSPCNATILPINTTCVNTLGTNVDATATTGVPDPNCANYSATYPDVWYTITIPASGNLIITTSDAGGNDDGGLALYSGNCGSLILEDCEDDNNGFSTFEEFTLSSQVPGTQFWIRVWDYDGDQGTFNICAVEPQPPTNDDPCNAISLAVNTTCTNTTGTNLVATSSAGVPVPGCASYIGGDIWYTAVVPADGILEITTSSTGDLSDLGIATYSGSCGALTLISCDDDSGTNDFSALNESGLTPFSTIWIRVWEPGNDQSGEFDICVTEFTDCGTIGETNVGTNDYCSSPATLTTGTGTFSATTAATFSEDEPGDVEFQFCGSIENNSWYQFTASNTTETFDIVSVTGCTGGIQAEVYDISYTAGGCCDVFTSVSNCYNPASTALGVVTATGLTVSQDYMLMVDGQGGANCDFTIAGWTGINILPVEMLSFYGYTYEKENLLTWTTVAEANNDYFIIEKSTNGVDYTKIGTVNGNGNSTSKIDYSFSDNEINFTLAYYRLKQVDFDGTHVETGTIKMTKELNNVYSFPNPATNELNFTFNSDYNGDVTIDYIDVSGKIFSEKAIINSSMNYRSALFQDLSSGIYFTRISENGIIIQTMKIIKE